MASRLDARIVKRRLASIPLKFPRETGRALGLETDIEVKEVKRRTPVRRGDLRNTVRREGPIIKGRMIETSILAGSPQVTYALPVHEDLDVIHRVGQAKYIESVILESKTKIARRVARRIELKRAMAR